MVDVMNFEHDAPFDAVLLDAPCSATGTIRRHPDIPWARRPADVVHLAGFQTALIDHAIGLLRPGGILVYATCSLELEEGEQQAHAAIARGKVERVKITPDEVGGNADWLTRSGDLRTLPFHTPGVPGGMDGFFATRLRRLA